MFFGGKVSKGRIKYRGFTIILPPVTHHNHPHKFIDMIIMAVCGVWYYIYE